MTKVIIVDDEDNGRQLIERLIAVYFSELQVVASCCCIEEAEQAIRTHSPDIVFLDIEMPGGSGFELLQHLGEIDFAVVFVTAHEAFALKALKLSAVDYILKPPSQADLQTAISKSMEFVRYRQFYHENLKTLTSNHLSGAQEKKLVINKYKGEEIAFKDIVFVEADVNYSKVHGRTKSYTLSKNLGELEELLCGLSDRMIRIHKSYIVNVDFLESLPQHASRPLLTLKGGTQLEVSKRRWVLLREFLRHEAARLR